MITARTFNLRDTRHRNDERISIVSISGSRRMQMLMLRENKTRMGHFNTLSGLCMLPNQIFTETKTLNGQWTRARKYGENNIFISFGRIVIAKHSRDSRVDREKTHRQCKMLFHSCCGSLRMKKKTAINVREPRIDGIKIQKIVYK